MSKSIPINPENLSRDLRLFLFRSPTPDAGYGLVLNTPADMGNSQSPSPILEPLTE